MKTFTVKKWFDDSLQIKFINSKNYQAFTPSYKANALDIFVEHHMCGGMDQEEATDLFNESPFPKVEKWLKKRGYEL